MSFIEYSLKMYISFFLVTRYCEETCLAKLDGLKECIILREYKHFLKQNDLCADTKESFLVF